MIKRFHDETGHRAPHGFDMGGNPSYSGITHADIEAFNKWCEAHKDELPKPVEADAEESPQ